MIILSCIYDFNTIHFFCIFSYREKMQYFSYNYDIVYIVNIKKITTSKFQFELYVQYFRYLASKPEILTIK